jgi:hypothetical protein
MMKHRNEPDNSDRELPAQSDRSESPAGDASTGSYYYDDATGYELYDGDEDEGEEE